MKKQAWDRFMRTGKVADYLAYRFKSENKTDIFEKFFCQREKEKGKTDHESDQSDRDDPVIGTRRRI